MYFFMMPRCFGLHSRVMGDRWLLQHARTYTHARERQLLVRLTCTVIVVALLFKVRTGVDFYKEWNVG